MIALMMIESEEERVSFETLYEETYRRFIVVARGILHNENDAEEIVQDVYVEWAKHYRKYKKKPLNEMEKLGVTMTKNRCIDLIRKRKAHTEIPIEINENLLGEAENDILGDMISEENISELVQQLKKLNEKEQVLLELRYAHEFSYQEIAKEMHLSVQNVKVRLYRIKKKLREVLADE